MKRPFRRASTSWLALALATLLLVAAGNVLLVRDAATRANVSNTLQLVAGLIAAGTVIGAARKLRRSRSNAVPGWTLLGIGGALVCAGALVFGLVEARWHGVRSPNVSDAFFLPSYLFLAAGIVRLPRERLSGGDWWDAVLDLLILGLVTGIAFWELSLRGQLSAFLVHFDVASLVALAYTLLNIALLFVLYHRLVLNVGHGRLVVPSLLLVAAGLCLAITDQALAYAASTTPFRSGSPVDLGWMLVAVLAGLAGLYVLDRDVDERIASATESRALWSTGLSYTCLAGASALLAWGAYRRDFDDILVIGLTVAGIVVLVGVRRVRAVRESARLTNALERARADLETKVRERTAELEATAASLRESDEKFRFITEQTGDLLALGDENGVITYASLASRSLFHAEPEEMCGRHFVDFLDEAARPKALAAFRRSMEGEPRTQSLELTMKRKDGSTFVGELSGSGFGGTAATRTLVIIRDITERRRTDQALRESEERLRTAAEATGFGIFAHDFATGESYYSPEFLTLFGLAPGEALALDADSVPLMLHPDDRAAVVARIRSATDPMGPGILDGELRILLPDGAVRWLRARGRTVFGGHAATDLPVRAHAIIQDITDRKRAEEALRRSESDYRQLFDTSPTGMVLIGPDGCIVRANREQSRMCGFDSPDELIGVHATRLVAPSCRDRSAEVLRRRLGGEDIPPVAYELLRNDGSTFLGETSATILRRPDGTVSGYVCSTVDTTESVRAEEQLRALSGHLVALREEDHTRMAREIHDELGQGLSALRLDLSWLARKLPAGTDVLRRRAEASIALIDDLIAVGQRIVADLRPPILDDLGLVPAMEWFVQRFTEHSGIPTTLESGSMPAPLLSGPLAVVGYRIVQEALTNVARHAQARHATVRIAMDGGQLLLEVRDDGRGISQGGLDDPHAYGLVGMRERAASQGGTVRITGAPGRGTTVLVTLPLQPPAVEAR